MGSERENEGKGSQMQRRRQELPAPTEQFRLRAWREFQKALDPLARPKPLPRKSAY
jgi:hypothetical protein